MLNVDGSVTASTIIGFCGGEQDSRLRRPSGLAFDSQGYLYVTSFINMVGSLRRPAPCTSARREHTERMLSHARGAS